MGIQKIQKTEFKTSDGNIFTDENKAIEHESVLKESIFKINDRVCFIKCIQGDYADEDRYYYAEGVITKIKNKTKRMLR